MWTRWLTVLLVAGAVGAGVAVAGTPTRAPQVAEANIVTLAGKWTGSYSYDRVRNPAKPFEVNIMVRTDKNRFSGKMSEPKLRSNAKLISMINGTMGKDGKLSFVKKYYPSSGMTEPVTYRGALAEDGKSITGTWKTESGLTGSFEMKKAN